MCCNCKVLKFAYACVCFFVGNIVTLSRTCFQTCVGEERHCDWREHVPAFASGSWRDPAHLPNVVGWHWNIYLQGDLGGWQWLSQRPPPSQVCIFTQCLPSLIVLFLVGFFPLCFFFFFYMQPGHDGWMFPPLLWFITALLSNPSNPSNIYNASLSL